MRTYNRKERGLLVALTIALIGVHIWVSEQYPQFRTLSYIGWLIAYLFVWFAINYYISRHP